MTDLVALSLLARLLAAESARAAELEAERDEALGKLDLVRYRIEGAERGAAAARHTRNRLWSKLHAARARIAELEKRVAVLEGELGPLRTQRSDAFVILASIAAELGADEETRWECLPEMARALATPKINPDTVLWSPTEEGQADA
ncbi:hypothetical protein [Nocardia farcinica]|uniref:hypothetical protein n=1 Tax=Nocardia farcinica TaxID=37329 RepID=UPI0024574DB3|nr:hypothetical protein [Nocardia farcinica]